MRCWFDPWVGKIPWRSAWQPTPVFLPGEAHGQRSLVCYSPWGRRESDTTDQLTLSLRLDFHCPPWQRLESTISRAPWKSHSSTDSPPCRLLLVALQGLQTLVAACRPLEGAWSATFTSSPRPSHLVSRGHMGGQQALIRVTPAPTQRP